METIISMLMIFTIVLCYLSSSQRKAWKFRKWPAPIWPDSSTGRALLRHRGQGSSPVQAWIFQAFLLLLLEKHNITTKIINIETIFQVNHEHFLTWISQYKHPVASLSAVITNSWFMHCLYQTQWKKALIAQAQLQKLTLKFICFEL